MIVRHATQHENLASIQQHGLLPERSQGKLKVTWLHTPSRTEWAILHTIGRHGETLEDIIVIEIDLPRSWLVRAQKGLWKCGRTIPAARFHRIAPASEWAASPIKGN